MSFIKILANYIKQQTENPRIHLDYNIMHDIIEPSEKYLYVYSFTVANNEPFLLAIVQVADDNTILLKKRTYNNSLIRDEVLNRTDKARQTAAEFCIVNHFCDEIPFIEVYPDQSQCDITTAKHIFEKLKEHADKLVKFEKELMKLRIINSFEQI